LHSHVARQLVRASTSPAACYAEACHAESRRDFVHKMRVCLKELRETAVWLRLAARERPAGSLDTLTHECSELIAIFVASVKTAEANTHRQSYNPDRNR
jgi:four helix bundle protein